MSMSATRPCSGWAWCRCLHRVFSQQNQGFTNLQRACNGSLEPLTLNKKETIGVFLGFRCSAPVAWLICRSLRRRRHCVSRAFCPAQASGLVLSLVRGPPQVRLVLAYVQVEGVW